VGEVLTVAQLRRRLAEERAQGRKVALANGHFDLLHVGHLRFLEGARRQGDLLVVAINDDDSVRRLKGSGRPLMPATERAELLAALTPVDLVVIFEGTDYGSPEKVPEYATVRSYGGATVLVGDPKDHSTTDLIAKVRALPTSADG
jgi:cytidyltransferase-like protein